MTAPCPKDPNRYNFKFINNNSNTSTFADHMVRVALPKGERLIGMDELLANKKYHAYPVILERSGVSDNTKVLIEGKPASETMSLEKFISSGRYQKPGGKISLVSKGYGELSPDDHVILDSFDPRLSSIAMTVDGFLNDNRKDTPLLACHLSDYTERLEFLRKKSGMALSKDIPLKEPEFEYKKIMMFQGITRFWLHR